jgi:ATP-dependent DNA ligase
LRIQPPKSFVLDGEIVALDAASFNALQRAKTKCVSVHFYAFDLLNLNGTKLIDEPLTERQRLLLDELAPNGFFHVAGPLNADLETLLKKFRSSG